MRVAIFLVVLTVSISGCSGSRWVHDSANESQFQRDFYTCKIEAESKIPPVQNTDSRDLARMSPEQRGYVTGAALGAGFQRGLDVSNYQEYCMYSKGYRLERNSIW